MKGEQFIFPASYAQQRLWILEEMMPGNAFYNLSAPMRLGFQVNSLVLKKSLNEIVRRHETLRTTFTAIDGQPKQVIAASLDLDLFYHDLSGLAGSERETAAQQLINTDARKPFDLAEGPLLRTTLIKCGTEDFIFLLSMHHIISDGWSRFIFFRELTTLYELFSQGKPSTLPELPVQYADFAVWQRDYLKGEVLNMHIDYWKKRLKGMQALNLPLDKSRPALQSFAGNYQLLELSPDLSESIRKLGLRENITLFMILLAGFVGLLYKYTQQDDVVVGIPVANRNQTEIENLIGFFVNSILIRTDMSGMPSFIDLLRRVKAITLEAYEHEDLPFEMLVEAMQPERDLSRNPLFQVSFQFLQFPKIPGAASAGESPFLGVDKGTSIFDLRVSFAEYNGLLGGEIEYSTQLFEKDTIDRMCRHFTELMTKAVENPAKPLEEIEILQSDEKHQLLKLWNNTGKDFGSPALLHHLFEEQAKLTPDRVAVVFKNTQLLYEELNNQSNQLAHYLLAHGVLPGSFVGVCVERSDKLIVSFLAILKAGAAYIPMDPSYPAGRLQMVIDDAGMEAMISQHSMYDNLFSYGGSVIFLDEEWEKIMKEEQNNPNVDPDELSIAYVIYTSGSTGRPKGVMIPHAAICNHMLWMKEQFPLDLTDMVMQRTAYSFDASVWEFYAPLIAGSRLFIAEDEESRDPDYLVEKIIQYSITVLQVVPSMLRLLLEHPDIDQCVSLKRVYCGGSVLLPKSVQAFYRLLPAQLYNLYGPTEATIDVSCWHCRIEKDHERVSIGKPISNIRFYVLDKEMNPVPIGIPGELWIGGSGLARGYLGNRLLTAAKFQPDPFSGKPGERMYRTGDKVRYRTDGNLEYLERIDQQIKLRGFRIEPGDIESALRSHGEVNDALVLLHQLQNDEQLLIAYIIPEHIDLTGATAYSTLLSSVNDHLRQKLPEYMVPALIMPIPSIPLKPNGKIDLSMLPGIPQNHTGLSHSYAPPETNHEMVLTGIWANLFKLERVGIHDHFFRLLGGNSLLATQMTSRVREHFRISIPLQGIFKAPTIHLFGKLIEEHINKKTVLA
ncbi:amino acid adenylation domain-containing protein [Agriterribacter sp.]|uniref:non-ribosomal peptide synthetase n=1 Tax=Agriterribacter sp. TaxID=2821509 RepID=UPI002CC84D29|nr:amino acid adenylation domain-containing protein [Agriterribacter sp.]HRP55249.1 amino acid adenylation domain-containing protein [Agriterribacter sp.]